jgi:hypothetical protein
MLVAMVSSMPPPFNVENRFPSKGWHKFLGSTMGVMVSGNKHLASCVEIIHYLPIHDFGQRKQC